MTRRGRAALGLGLATYAAAWAFGSDSLYPVAVGIVLVVVVAAAWVRLSAGGAPDLRIARDAVEPHEGDDVTVEAALRLRGALPPPSVTLVERLGKLGEVETALERAVDGTLRGRYVLRGLRRGRYPLLAAEAVVEDPFGLERVHVPVPAAGSILVYPRLVELDRLFTDTGARLNDGRKLLLRRPAGFDLHSVREYEEGESLRKVHWPTTARRGELMVKELEDAPRDELAVLLDADASAVVGESFDVQVRAAGSLLQAHVRRGRRCALVLAATTSETRRVHADADAFRHALDLLAAVEPGSGGAAAAVADAGGVAARALDLVVVTARLAPMLVERLARRSAARQTVSVVYVDASSFADAPRRADPSLLRLAAAGIAIAVVRRGDDLAAALSASTVGEAARA